MWARRLHIASFVLFAIYVAGAVLLAAYIFKHASFGRPVGELWSGLLVIALVYLGSHVVRSVRLYVILLEFERSFTRILALYATLTFVNRMFPLKLGEAFRFTEFTHALKSPRLALVVIATERFFDAIILAWLLLYGLMLDGSIVEDTTVLLIALSTVIIFGALLYRGLPGFARYLRYLAATRSRGRRGLTALRIAKGFDDLWRDMHRMLHGRAIVLALISFVVWALEIAAMGLIVNLFAGQTAADFPGALLRALNSLLVDGLAHPTMAIEVYFVMTFAVIAVTSAPLLLYYSFVRVRDFHIATENNAGRRPHYVRGDASQPT